jgi:hypothetical protein
MRRIKWWHVVTWCAWVGWFWWLMMTWTVGILNKSLQYGNTLKNHHVWSFASKLCTYRASSGHLGKATASGYVDHSGLLISVMIEEHPAEDQHVTFTYKSTAILRYFKHF